MDKDKIKILLLVGGTSPEKEVSKESGHAVYKALKETGYNVTVVDPGYGLDQPADVNLLFGPDYAEKKPDGILEIINSDKYGNTDLIFNTLHGDWGEDGHYQALFDMKKIKYTGSGVLASALGMSKVKSKILFERNGVPTAPWIIVEDKNFNAENILEEIKNSFGYPCIIKPNAGGSTVGLSLCYEQAEVTDAIRKAFNYSDEVLIEKFIKGRELTVGILVDKQLPVLEIKPKNIIYDYECKYTDGMSQYEVPAKISPEVAAKLQDLGRRAFKAVGCKDYSRVDFLLTEENEAYCLEINTLPGMTSHSLVPMMAAEIGISFNELCTIIVESGLNESI